MSNTRRNKKLQKKCSHFHKSLCHRTRHFGYRSEDVNKFHMCWQHVAFRQMILTQDSSRDKWARRLALQPFLFHSATAPSEPGPPWSWFHYHSDTPRPVGLPSTNDNPVADISTWQHTTLARGRHPCPRWDLNTQSRQAIGRRPTP